MKKIAGPHMKKIAGRILFSASFATLLFLGVGQTTRSAVPQAQSQNQAQMKTAMGKVTSIQSATFTIELQDQSTNAPRTVEFTMDSHTTVTGKVNLGDNAIVQYRVTDDGKNLAVNIAPQNA